MKKIIFRTMAIVLVLGVAACSRTDETADTPSDQKITELGVIAQSTRSTLGDDNWVEWDANDSFSVFSSMSFSSEFTIKELLDEGHGAKLEGMTIPADTYYILYPYIMDAMIAEGRHDLRRGGVGGHLPAREEGTQRTLSLLAHSAAYDRCLFYTVTGLG